MKTITRSLLCLLVLTGMHSEAQNQNTVRRSGIMYYHPSEGAKKKETFLPGANSAVSITNIKVNQDATTYQQNETTISINPLNPNILVGGANDQRDGGYKPGFYYTTNQGNNWNGGLLSLGGSYDAGGDPAVSFDNNGNAWYSHVSYDTSGDWMDNGVFVNKSTNGGANWLSSPLIVARNGDGTGTANTQPYFEDKPYLSCDISAGSQYANNVYVSWTRFFRSGAQTQIFFSSLSAGTGFFSPPYQISDAGDVQGSVPAVGPNGIVYVVWWNGNGSLRIDKSTNGGLAFGTDQNVVSGVVEVKSVKPTNIRANSFPSIAVDISGGIYNGNVYIVWGDRRNGDPDIYFVRGVPNGGALHRLDAVTSEKR